MSSPFVTVRYPSGEWELALSEKVPKVGDILSRSGGKWVVAKAAEDTNGHIIVTWRPAPRPTDRDEAHSPEVAVSKKADTEKQEKQKAQKPLEERRRDKRAAKKLGSGSLSG